jgi:hypothetical protein
MVRDVDGDTADLEVLLKYMNSRRNVAIPAAAFQCRDMADSFTGMVVIH